jgi:crotonobetainyl-CoA:carnitine CoA-transferase CaiB-like acyl-CoA transferase
MSTIDELKVVEIASGAPAAYAARLLLHLGASVTKVSVPGVAANPVPELDEGKAITRIHPESGPPLAMLDEILLSADVVIRSDEAGARESDLASLSRLRESRPSLVTAAITPFGERGPDATHRGVDLISIHAGGLGYGTPPRVVDTDSEHPLGIPGDPIQPLTALVAVLGILHALAERDRDSLGRHVEVSAQDAVVSLMFNNIATVVEGGASPGRLATDRPNARRPFLQAADGLLVQMAARPRHQGAWMSLIGAADEVDAGGRSGSARSQEASDYWTRARSRRDATDKAQAAHIPLEPVLTPVEVLECPQLAARGFWEVINDGTRVPGHPFGPVASSDAPRVLPAQASQGAGSVKGKERDHSGPLAGIRVVDFTWVFAGPIATRILAALGAEVIKVEAPESPEGPGRPFLSRTLQGGKRSARIDLRDPSGLAAVRNLIRTADVLVENFSTGVMERYGLGWEALHHDNPALTMLSVSGMGRTGPYAHHVMFGQLAQGYSGITAITGYEGGPPRGIEDGGFWSDPVAGYSAAAAVLAALRERTSTGRGRRIDVSLVEATVATMFRPILAAARGDNWGTRGNFHPEICPHDVYRAGPSDADRWVAIACRNDEDWLNLCEVLGRPDLAKDASLSTLSGRQARRQHLRTAIEEWTRSRSAEDCTALLQAAGIPAAPSRTTADVVHDPHLCARGIFVMDAAGDPAALRLPWELHPFSTVNYGPSPAPGEATASVLALGG